MMRWRTLVMARPPRDARAGTRRPHGRRGSDDRPRRRGEVLGREASRGDDFDAREVPEPERFPGAARHQEEASGRAADAASPSGPARGPEVRAGAGALDIVPELEPLEEEAGVL